MSLRKLIIGLATSIYLLLSLCTAHAQSGNDQSAVQTVNPFTGPSFPCPQPNDPLAQLVCSTPDLAQLDMKFVQTYEALYQQVGPSGDATVRHLDLQFDTGVRTTCGIGMSQASNPTPTPPPPAPAGAAACVIPLYKQQIALWTGMLQGGALEEASRSIQNQVALQTRLQALGFLPSQAQMDGVFGTGTRAAIEKWQTSVGRQPTGILDNDDAQALLGTSAPYATNQPPEVAPQPPMSVTQFSSAENSSSNSTNIIPINLQGVWSHDCTGSANNSADYLAFGPSQVMINSSAGSGIAEAVQFISGRNGFAVSEDDSFNSNGGTSQPDIHVVVGQIISADEISVVALFDNSEGVMPGGSTVLNRCGSNPVFSNSFSQVTNFVAPTSQEISVSQTVFSSMPPVMETKWSIP